MARVIKSQFEKLFNVNQKQGENGAAGFTIDARAEINVYEDALSIGHKETLFNIKDRTDDDFKFDNPNSKASIVGIALDAKQISINERYIGDLIDGPKKKTLVHEIGHTAGLRHPKMDYGLHWGGLDGYKKTYLPGTTAHLGETSNFMNQGDNPTPTGPTHDQIYRMYNLYRSGKLNNGNINAVEQ